MSVGQGHGILYTFGNPTYGNGPFERIGVPTTVPLLAGFLAACVVQVVAWLNAAVVLTFLVLAWTVQKGSSRSPSGGGRSSA